MKRKPDRLSSPFLRPLFVPRERYVENGRKGGLAKAARHPLRLAAAPSLRSVIDRTDLRRSAADAYAHALLELHAAREAAEAAYWTCDAAAIRRALRWVAAANVVADLRYDALVEAQ